MGSINGGLVFCPFLLKEKYQKFKADIMGLRTWRAPLPHVGRALAPIPE